MLYILRPILIITIEVGLGFIILTIKRKMYLPTFWKLTTEATMYRLRHVAGYGLPVGFLGKSNPHTNEFFSRLDHVPIFL